MKKILIYGYGNPGRQDDGLGTMLVERLEQRVLANQINYLFLVRFADLMLFLAV